MFNQKGSATTITVILFVVLCGLFMFDIQSKTDGLIKQNSRIRAFYDAEMAIEFFGKSLRAAYDKGNQYDELKIPIPTNSCNMVQVKGGKSSTDIINLCWNFGTDGLCFQRNNGAEPICLTTALNTNFASYEHQDSGESFFSNKEDVAFAVTLLDIEGNLDKEITPSYSHSFFQVFTTILNKFVGAILIQKAFAQKQAHDQLSYARPKLPWEENIITDPENDIELGVQSKITPNPCNSNTISPLTGEMEPTLDCQNFRTYPKELNCFSDEVECLRVKFCISSRQNCTQDQWIFQTYLFYKKPKTVFAN